MKKMYILYLLAGIIFLAIGILEFLNQDSDTVKPAEAQKEDKGIYFAPQFDGQELTIFDSAFHGRPWQERFYIGEGGKWKLQKTIIHEPKSSWSSGGPIYTIPSPKQMIKL